MWITGSVGCLVAPADGLPLWRGERHLWIVGDLSDEACRVVHDDLNSRRLAVVGSCYATETELRQGLDAVRRGNWHDLTIWPGSYWVIADDGQRTVVVTDVAGTKPVYYTAYQMAWYGHPGRPHSPNSSEPRSTTKHWWLVWYARRCQK